VFQNPKLEIFLWPTRHYCSQYAIDQHDYRRLPQRPDYEDHRGVGRNEPTGPGHLADKVAEEERKRGKIDTSTERTRQYMEVLNKLQQQTGNLLTDWKCAESHTNKKKDNEESSSIFQEFQNHWESTNCESQLTIARINISFMEKAVEEIRAVQAKEQQRRDEAEHPAPIPSHLIQTPKLELPKFTGDITLFPEFWEIFSPAIHNHLYMTDDTKLIYLKGALQGDAKDIVASVQVGDDNSPKQSNC
ncbi:hypothetical protein GCK32_022732, partial [Trichostrongylus colubriformis]